MTRSLIKSISLLGALLLALAPNVHAQPTENWPTRPIRLVVSFPAGGGTDSIARFLGEKMAAELHGSVVVENRPGAGGIIGAQNAAGSPADGYTVFLGTNSTLVSNKYLYAKLPYNPENFEPLGLIGVQPLVLVVNPSLPVKTLAELVAYAKANPGKLNYASFGQGTTSHLAAEMLKQMAGIDMVHVPFKGAAEAIPALLSGSVSVYFDTIVSSLPHIKAGKMRVLAVTTAKRSGALPSVPTIAEQGYPNYEMYPWYGLTVLKATPKEIQEKLRNTLAKSLADPDLRKRMTDTGTEVTYADAQEFANLIRSDAGKTERLVKSVGISIQ
ncbi:tripartite tricarboxylate transporter substrate binding protein [Cupriavidus pauculus]|uniref:Bug family tripartite tricarboxylate transporter substrate binding protein n=1 Tax=Cupriavidus pauculus TaxID=82633 RepID=UPI001EE16F62|nr:tripartite tricarboxylate transporter substrate binding protein [Cupriavidus pauculus]GJG96726.1 tripartite tricarboxylate transporter substrate binding protein [Cupriavidus pauculus]